LLKKGAVVIPKATSIEHLEANANLDGWDLSGEDIKTIDNIALEEELVDAHYT